jgi:hypothetical protein
MDEKNERKVVLWGWHEAAGLDKLLPAIQIETCSALIGCGLTGWQRQTEPHQEGGNILCSNDENS